MKGHCSYIENTRNHVEINKIRITARHKVKDNIFHTQTHTESCINKQVKDTSKIIDVVSQFPYIAHGALYIDIKLG